MISRPLPAAPFALAAVACCAAVLAPWARTGTATRSGFAFVRAVQAAGLGSGAWPHLFAVLVFALPLLAGLSSAAAAVRAFFASAAFLGVAGAVVVVFSATTFVLFGTHVAPGPWIGAVTGGAAVVMAVRGATKVLTGRERKPAHRN
jgi:hypothetical protein